MELIGWKFLGGVSIIIGGWLMLIFHQRKQLKEYFGHVSENVESALEEAISDFESLMDDAKSKMEDESNTVKEKQEPADWQRFLMRNYENIFPILYTILGVFVIAWVANGTIGFVDGSGGNVAFDGTVPVWHDPAGTGVAVEVQPGEIYPCDKSIQESGCKNSLAPFAGESDANVVPSLPVGFYWDGIMFIGLGLVGMGGTALLQMHIKKMLAEHRKKKAGNEDDSSADQSEEDDSEDDGDQEEDGIEIGSRVGVEDEDGDWYGFVIEFDDEEDAVVVIREDDGEEYLVDWDALFQDDW